MSQAAAASEVCKLRQVRHPLHTAPHLMTASSDPQHDEVGAFRPRQAKHPNPVHPGAMEQSPVAPSTQPQEVRRKVWWRHLLVLHHSAWHRSSLETFLRVLPESTKVALLDHLSARVSSRREHPSLLAPKAEARVGPAAKGTVHLRTSSAILASRQTSAVIPQSPATHPTIRDDTPRSRATLQARIATVAPSQLAPAARADMLLKVPHLANIGQGVMQNQARVHQEHRTRPATVLQRPGAMTMPANPPRPRSKFYTSAGQQRRPPQQPELLPTAIPMTLTIFLCEPMRHHEGQRQRQGYAQRVRARQRSRALDPKSGSQAGLLALLQAVDPRSVLPRIILMTIFMRMTTLMAQAVASRMLVPMKPLASIKTHLLGQSSLVAPRTSQRLRNEHESPTAIMWKLRKGQGSRDLTVRAR